MSTTPEFIKKKLEETGFPVELEIFSEVDAHGWVPIAQDSYFDEDEKKVRTIDIAAQYAPYNLGAEYVIDLSPFKYSPKLVIECKKSKKNWVFFPMNQSYIKMDGNYFSKLEGLGGYNVFNLMHLSTTLHYNWEKYNISSIYTIIDQGKDEINEGVMQVIKYILYSRKKMKDPDLDNKYLGMWFPIIVYDGELWEAEIKKGQIQNVLKSNHIRLNRLYELNNNNYSFIIDVVTKSYFPSLMKIISEDIRYIENTIKDNATEYLRKYYTF